MSIFNRSILTTSIAAILVSAAANAANEEHNLNEVIVTATRAPTDLASYAGSIGVISDEEIATVGATHHTDILNRVAGANFQRGSGQESLTAIRSPVLAGPGSCGSFLFMEDSIPIRPVGSCNVNDLFEVNMNQAASIELQRGPSSAVYGSSAMHGAVNVVPKSAAAMPMLAAGLDAGQDSYLRSDLTLAHHADNYAVGLTGNFEHDGGWRDHSGLNEQKVNLSYHQALSNSTLDVHVASTNLKQDTAGYIVGLNTYRDPNIARSNANPEAFRNAHATRVWAHWQVPLSDNTSFDVRPYVRTSRMEFLQHFLIGKPLENNGQDSVGMITTLQHTFGMGASILAGVDFETANSTLLEEQALPSTDGTAAANKIRPAGKHYDYEVKSKVAAAYLHYEQAIGESWKATLGVRGEYVGYDYDNKMIDGNTAADGTNPCGVAGCLYQRPGDRSDGFNSVTPKLGLTWSYTKAHSLYASASRGYRAPETTELYRLQRQQTSAVLDPEYVRNVELGARGTLATVLHYTLAVFTMHKDNVIYRDSLGFNFSNGATDHQGFEYEFAWSPAETLDVAVAGTWAKHTYDFSAAADGAETITAGNDIDTAPRYMWNARLNWHILPQLSAELEAQHMGAYWADAANTHRYEGHNLLNLRTAWSISNSWQAIARVTNVLDRAFADRADVSFGNDRYFPGRGRAVFLEARYEMR